MRADDALKYAAALLKSRTDWALDAIGGSLCNQEGHELETDALYAITVDIAKLAAQFGDPLRYSDGRMVKSSKEIDRGFTTEHIWHPVAELEEVRSHRGNLLSGDPDLPPPGIYEVTTYPATQQIHVRVVRTA
ncbi:hypothetical protein BA059_16675 [Mycolicibacterium sp. (ex Dasyatis americana)]|nr:hypothetical protein BA059_16675 [Mycolicibacterium sp. (ex Dasyatis americana)]